MTIRRMAMVLVCVTATTLVAFGQAPNVQPNRADAAPVVTYELNWHDANPQWFYVSVASTGAAAYKSQPHVEGDESPGDPFTVEFTASEPTRTRIFELAKAVNYFKGDFEFKGNVAKTGTKTLTFRNGEVQSKTSFNYSGNSQLMELTSIFQNISNTLEFGRRLAYQAKYDKLGVEALLKRMEDLKKSGMLLEIQAIEPVLKQVATDRSYMNVARQRAQRLLGLPVSPAGSR